jgi:hypothetical protein
MANQKVQDKLRNYLNYLHTSNKKLEKTQKQTHELREDFIKQQSETKKTLKI